MHRVSRLRETSKLPQDIRVADDLVHAVKRSSTSTQQVGGLAHRVPENRSQLLRSGSTRVPEVNLVVLAAQFEP